MNRWWHRISLIIVVVLFLASASAEKISTCRNLTKADTVYYLDRDVSSHESCFNILADNVTLDCQGHEINYSITERGFAVDNSKGYSHMTVRNCVIVEGRIRYPRPSALSERGENYGIYFKNASDSAVENNTITTKGDASVGVIAQSSSGWRVTGNNILSVGIMGYGVYAYECDGPAQIENNTIETKGGAGFGIQAVNSRLLTIKGNTITTANKAGDGIRFHTCYNMTVTQNKIMTNVTLNQLMAEEVEDANASTASVAKGIELGGDCDNNLIYNNTIFSAEGYGIVFVTYGVGTPEGNIIFNNIINGVIDFVRKEPRSLFVPLLCGILFILWRRRTKVVVDGKILEGFKVAGPASKDPVSHTRIYAVAQMDYSVLNFATFIELSESETDEAEKLATRCGILLDTAKDLILCKKLHAKTYLTTSDLPEEIHENFNGTKILRP